MSLLNEMVSSSELCWMAESESWMSHVFQWICLIKQLLKWRAVQCKRLLSSLAEIALNLIWNVTDVALKRIWIPFSEYLQRTGKNRSEIALILLWNRSKTAPEMHYYCSGISYNEVPWKWFEFFVIALFSAQFFTLELF